MKIKTVSLDPDVIQILTSGVTITGKLVKMPPNVCVSDARPKDHE